MSIIGTPISNVASGQLLDPDWGNAVADGINDLDTELANYTVFDTYTPGLTNCSVGTGGSVFNSATYVYVGGPNTGDYGILQVSGRLVLGTGGGANMGTGPAAALPSGFQAQAPASTGQNRLGLCTVISSIGFVQWSSSTAVAFVVAGAGSTYVSGTTITSSVPGTWAAGDALTYNYTVPVQRV